MSLKESVKVNAQRVWKFIWHTDSLASWIVNIVLAFVLIKFVVYPVLGALLGTSFPLVAVVSPSMEHEPWFDEWWTEKGAWYEQRNITKAEFQEFPMRNGFNKCDIIVLRQKQPENIELGDIIVFVSHRDRPRQDPIIHRVVKKWEVESGIRFATKGDANNGQIDDCSDNCLDETNIAQQQVLGVSLLRIPYLGWVKIAFVSLIGQPYCSITNNLWPCRGV